MALADEYRAQFHWRPWSAIMDALPPLRDQLVLDLGCGVGDQAAELAKRGARVVGVDSNEELLREARRTHPDSEFQHQDISDLPQLGTRADGIWCSFVTAYFPDLPRVLASWTQSLRPGGWIALTEIDNLFGHEPLGRQTKAVFDEYARQALEANRYDFFMGRKLRAYLEGSGFQIQAEMVLEDQELSFTGPAPQAVGDAWSRRIDRMRGFRDFAVEDFDRIREELLECLASPPHSSTARVICCIGSL